MALKTRADYYGVHTNINTKRLYPISHLVSTVTGMSVQRNKAIVGRNAFATKPAFISTACCRNAQLMKLCHLMMLVM